MDVNLINYRQGMCIKANIGYGVTNPINLTDTLSNKDVTDDVLTDEVKGGILALLNEVLGKGDER